MWDTVRRVTCYCDKIQRRRGLQKFGGEEVAIFRQTAGNFRQSRLWVLKRSISPPNFPKMGCFAPNFVFLEGIFDEKKICQHVKIYGGVIAPTPCHDAIDKIV